MPGKYGIHLVQHYEASLIIMNTIIKPPEIFLRPFTETGVSRNKATFMVAGCFKSWKSRVKWMMNMMIWGYSHGHGNLQKYLAQLTEPLVKTPPVLADLPDLLQAPDHSLLDRNERTLCGRIREENMAVSNPWGYPQSSSIYR